MKCCEVLKRFEDTSTGGSVLSVAEIKSITEIKGEVWDSYRGVFPCEGGWGCDLDCYKKRGVP